MKASVGYTLFCIQGSQLLSISNKMVGILNTTSNDLTTVEMPSTAMSPKVNKPEEEEKNGVYLVNEYHQKDKVNSRLNLNEVFKKNYSRGKQMINKTRRNRVETSESNNATAFESCDALRNMTELNSLQSMDSEKLWHQEKAQEREEVFESILLDQSIEFSWLSSLL